MHNHSCAERVCPAKYLHAQQGCSHCLEELLCAHDKLVGLDGEPSVASVCGLG